MATEEPGTGETGTSSTAEPLFKLTKRFQASIALINTLDNTKLHAVLTRIIQKLHLRDEDAFTGEEQTQLTGVLGLDERQLDTVLDVSAYIFEQAAYIQATTVQLKIHLERAGLSKEKNIAFLRVWESARPTLIENLKNRTIVPRTLKDVSWQLHLQLSQSSLARVKTPSAIFQLEVAHESGTEKVRMELDHDDLFAFYDRLNVIQKQLDDLS
mmetsp:Transcript_2865/g.6982  ORF Transcript_2865/g.6982 Transcript_2865/m.6982 type:complete len:213 (-) Transcript_2865:33-671(-)|eukprot:CAMPEP_0177664952 /NCGR_PEP_ID=MMETSP0447-20121125/20789_1 /TAXON_ID=0 /ORGANISM="Stygamoeba regulata, Strain BSH-02190019" /LENGTH=212 /DNA_ID=CAMNT_0019171001 /DNA_START=223 /DNA_END=861 /DNA_ORIENTATION=-